MMFRRVRSRLTLVYAGLFAIVLATFSVVFYIGFATVLAPTFDVDPELTNEQVADAARQVSLERIGLSLIVADVIVIGLVAAAAWVLAARTLRPIREVHERQRRFVADASHEMRTPLAAIRSSAESALAGSGSQEDLRRALATVARASERLSKITTDLLLLARTDELPGGPYQPVDLSVIVVETVDAFATAHPNLPRPRLTLGTDLPVAADPVEIGRVVANLLDNAIRYSRGATDGGARIVTRSADRDAIVEVADDGPGIAPADLDRIFEPFYRVHADAETPEGTGLGLAIARSLAHRNGGRLSVSSQLAAGATFRLSLPRARSAKFGQGRDPLDI